MIKNTRVATGPQNSPDKKLHSLLASMVAFVPTQMLCNKIDELVAKGANVNGEKGQGELLLLAVNHANAVALGELLARGADPHVQVRQDGCSTTLLHVAAGKGKHRAPRVILMLVAAGLDPYETKDSNGLTAKAIAMEFEGVSPIFSYPLHFSVRVRDMPLCSEFLRRGFNPDTTDHRGDSPAKLAKTMAMKDICALFDADKARREINDLMRQHCRALH